MSDRGADRDRIVDHYRAPRNFGSLPAPDRVCRDENPLCGDDLTVELHLQDGVIADLRFNGTACAVTVAAASIASEELIGMEAAQALSLDENWILQHVGPDLSPGRRQCAQMCLRVVRGALSGTPSWPSQTR